MTNLAIVVLNWNGIELLNTYIPELVANTPKELAEIWVIDNASTDRSLDWLAENYPEIKTIVLTKNYGYTGGYNKGLKQIDSEYYCLINSDVRVTLNWLSPVLDNFKKNKKTAIIQPKILDDKKPNYFEYAGAAGGFIDQFGYPYCNGRVFESIEKDSDQYNSDYSIFWASGACFFIESKVFFELEGFDESFFAHQEEIDLCWRAQNAGYQVNYVGSSSVYHLGGATLNYYSPRKTFLNFRNNLLMLLKNLPSNKIIPIIFTRLVLDGMAGIRMLFQLKPLNTLAIIKAHFSFYVNIPQIWRKRKKQKSVLKKYWKAKHIIYTHFIKKERV